MGQVFIADCNILKCSLLWQCVRSGVLCVQVYNVSKACILVVFEKIWNCTKIIENNVSKACIIVLFETIWNCSKDENKDAYACNMTRFDTTFWLAENVLKAMKLNGAFWCCYARRLVVDPIVLPTRPNPSFFITSLDVLFFSFFEMKCRPGSTGPIEATPVT